jgi:aminobenzoyl-glutamate utilization protein B
LLRIVPFRRNKLSLNLSKKHQQELIALSDSIWKFVETALMEHKSSKLLADYAEQRGFRVTRGVTDLPTAFIAS